MADCIFCKIINGEIPAEKVFETNGVLVFLDINPVNKGHLLIVPKKHFDDLLGTVDEILCELWQVAKKVGIALKEAVEADGINFSVNNGRAAGQVIFHIHIHVVPRFEGDGLRPWASRKYGDGEILKIGKSIRYFLDKIKNTE